MTLPQYSYRRLAELGWGLLTALLVVLGEVAIAFDPSQVVDWRSWALGLVAGLVRGAGGALLAWLGRRALEEAAS